MLTFLYSIYFSFKVAVEFQISTAVVSGLLSVTLAIWALIELVHYKISLPQVNSYAIMMIALGFIFLLAAPIHEERIFNSYSSRKYRFSEMSLGDYFKIVFFSLVGGGTLAANTFLTLNFSP